MLDDARRILTDAWREPGFCVPNPDTYPFQWLWDSCFHAVVWVGLGEPERAITELESLLTHQGVDGFVPHVTYWADARHHADFWGRPGVSVLTQPPMWGHALAVLVDAGVTPPDDLAERARLGLRHLLFGRSRTPGGLVPVFHPWETGCDDSLRWDDWANAGGSSGRFDRDRWRQTKADLVAALELDEDGVPVGSSAFAVGSVAFGALVAWNVAELARVGLADRGLEAGAAGLAEALAARWDGETYRDDVAVGPGSTDGRRSSAGARTLEALLPILVEERAAVRAAIAGQLADDEAFAAPFGPRGAHADEEANDPDGYWRGSAWPQLLYLFELAGIETGLAAGAISSGWSEFWNPLTGRGRGARPQTWSALAALPRARG